MTPRLLGLSGSLRREAYSTAILRGLIDEVGDRAAFTLFDLAPVPLYNQDLDGAASPAPVVALRAAIAAADGLVVVSPEYNHGVPGVLKNALDWASRPAFGGCLAGKPVALVTSSPGALGGVRAQPQLRETFASTLSRVVMHREVTIAEIGRKVSDGRLVDRAALDFAMSLIGQLLADIRMLHTQAA